jgi:hypothetical protein
VQRRDRNDIVATRPSGRRMPSKVAGRSKFGAGLTSTPKA